MRIVPGTVLIVVLAVAGCGGERAAPPASAATGTPDSALAGHASVAPPAATPDTVVPGPLPLPAVGPAASIPAPQPSAVTTSSVVPTTSGPLGSTVADPAPVLPVATGARGQLDALLRHGLVAPELQVLDPIYAGDLTPVVLPEGTTVDEWRRAPWSAVYRPLRLDCALAGADPRADPPPDGSLGPNAVVLAQSRGRRATMLATAPHDHLPDPAALTACHTLGQLATLLGTTTPRETDSPGPEAEADKRRRSHASWSLYTPEADGRVTVLVVDAVVTRTPEDGDWQVAELTVLSGTLTPMARNAPAGRSASAAASSANGDGSDPPK